MCYSGDDLQMSGEELSELLLYFHCCTEVPRCLRCVANAYVEHDCLREPAMKYDYVASPFKVAEGLQTAI